MSRKFGLRAALLGLVMTASAALADDPNDPEMQTPEAVARDHELIRQLNLDMLAQVTERDRRYAQGWRAYALARSDPRYDRSAYEQRLADYERAQASYASDRQRYDQAMADWREDVTACRAGNWERCE